MLCHLCAQVILIQDTCFIQVEWFHWTVHESMVIDFFAWYGHFLSDDSIWEQNFHNIQLQYSADCKTSFRSMNDITTIYLLSRSFGFKYWLHIVLTDITLWDTSMLPNLCWQHNNCFSRWHGNYISLWKQQKWFLLHILFWHMKVSQNHTLAKHKSVVFC